MIHGSNFLHPKLHYLVTGRSSFAMVPMSLAQLNYLLAKQHNRPVFPRNQQHPMNRINDKAAVVHSNTRKK